MLLSPAVHPSGPSGAYSIAGAMSFESLYMINGVDVNENIRGQAQRSIIEDAVQETTVATAGVSAEFGRFSGGVINVVTKSGGNTVQRFVPRHTEQRQLAVTDAAHGWRIGPERPNQNHSLHGPAVRSARQRAVRGDGAAYPRDTKLNLKVPTYEYTFGGPIMKDHLWFFTAGRITSQDSTRQTFVTNIPYTFTDEQKRYEAKVTYSVNQNHRFQGAYTKIVRSQLNANQFNVMDTTSLYMRTCLRICWRSTTAACWPDVFRRSAGDEPPFDDAWRRCDQSGPHQRNVDARPHRRHTVLGLDVLRYLPGRAERTTMMSS